MDLELSYPLRPLEWPPIIHDLQKRLAGEQAIYLVGGAVRDVYRDQPLADIDLACAENARGVARKIANAFKGAYYGLDNERDIGRAILEYEGRTLVIDVARLRGTLLEDLQDRDFTFNAMCVPLDSDLNGIYDPLNGLRDWNEKVLRLCQPQAIANDPVRALRAVRQSLAFGLRFEAESREIIRRDGALLPSASIERVRDEFFALLGGNKPASGLMILKSLDLLRHVLPELDTLSPEAWREMVLTVDKLHILLTIISPRRDDNIGANAAYGTYVYLMDRFRGWLQETVTRAWPDKRLHGALLILAAAVRQVNGDAAEAARLAEERAISLKLSNGEVKRLKGAILYAGLPWALHQHAPISERDVYRFWRQTEQSGIDACLLAIAQYVASQGIYLDTPAWTAYLLNLAKLFDGYANAMALKPLLNGTDLMQAFDLSPSPLLGELLEKLREAQALGEINSVESALAYAKQLLNESPTTPPRRQGGA